MMVSNATEPQIRVAIASVLEQFTLQKNVQFYSTFCTWLETWPVFRRMARLCPVHDWGYLFAIARDSAAMSDVVLSCLRLFSASLGR
jgi:hypothetical protein